MAAEMSPSAREHGPMGRFRFGLFVGLLVFGPMAIANAAGAQETVFDNGPPVSTLGLIADVDNELVVADDFMVDTLQNAATIRWFGFYQGDEPPTPTRFLVQYHDDAAGEPDSQPFLIVDELITRQSTGMETNTRLPIFAYETDGPGLLQPATLYWVSIQKQDTGDPDYLWSASNALSGSALIQFQGGAWTALGVEQAFSLLPEPGVGASTWAVLISLLAMRSIRPARNPQRRR